MYIQNSRNMYAVYSTIVQHSDSHAVDNKTESDYTACNTILYACVYLNIKISIITGRQIPCEFQYGVVSFFFPCNQPPVLAFINGREKAIHCVAILKLEDDMHESYTLCHLHNA